VGGVHHQNASLRLFGSEAGENKSALAREFKVTRQTIYNVMAA